MERWTFDGGASLDKVCRFASKTEPLELRLNNEMEQDSLLRVTRSGHGRTEDNILHCSWRLGRKSLRWPSGF